MQIIKNINSTIDTYSQQTKPIKDEFCKYFTNRMNTVTGLTINEFSKYVSAPAFTFWTGSIFNAGVNNNNC